MTKRIIFIVPYKDFRDEEYFVPKEVFSSQNIKYKTASNELGTALGADGGEIKVDFKIEDIEINSFEALVFVGGPGCLKYLDNEKSYDLLKKAVFENKIIASICISPIILSKAGILKDKKATVWSSELNREPIKILKENGAVYEDQEVVVDGNIITANGPSAAMNFAKKIIEKLDTDYGKS